LAVKAEEELDVLRFETELVSVRAIYVGGGTHANTVSEGAKQISHEEVAKLHRVEAREKQPPLFVSVTFDWLEGTRKLTLEYRNQPLLR
jgi:hypothetical protein